VALGGAAWAARRKGTAYQCHQGAHGKVIRGCLLRLTVEPPRARAGGPAGAIRWGLLFSPAPRAASVAPTGGICVTPMVHPGRFGRAQRIGPASGARWKA